MNRKRESTGHHSRAGSRSFFPLCFPFRRFPECYCIYPGHLILQGEKRPFYCILRGILVCF